MPDLLFLKNVIHNISLTGFYALGIPVTLASVFFYVLAVWSLFLKKNKGSSVAKEFPFVTVQIPTYNEPVALRCAESALAFDYPKDRFEVMIGDDSSKEEVRALIDEFAKKHEGRVVVSRRGSNKGFKPGNLNEMTPRSRGEIIVIFDSDFVAPPDFLRRIVVPFEDPKVACVQAKWAYLNMDQSITSKFASTVLLIYHNILARINTLYGVPLLFGSGEAIRKETLLKLGGWQEGSLTEDVEFSVRVLTEGYKTVYLHDLTASGEVPYILKSLRIQQKRWAYGNMMAFLKYRKEIFSRRFSFMQKILLSATMLGYISSLFLVAFSLVGILSLMTGNFTQVDTGHFFSGFIFNVGFSSGFMFAGMVSLVQEKKLASGLKVILGAFTVGILVSFSVSRGLFQALRRRPMDWTMIKKQGNEQFFSSTI